MRVRPFFLPLALMCCPCQHIPGRGWFQDLRVRSATQKTDCPSLGFFLRMVPPFFFFFISYRHSAFLFLSPPETYVTLFFSTPPPPPPVIDLVDASSEAPAPFFPNTLPRHEYDSSKKCLLPPFSYRKAPSPRRFPN